ncbi:putative bifunctional inhibitor/plant lipid transfer protein/seed storage helical [Medicago truncatula]|uniref:Lipid transfer protein n=1 Tax=Medicago truncatula TaxID=3880 RepID=A0A072UX29_MEDTR|nr:putative lipid-transfer protein DIR1 [Medicago truncatula]KEH30405.1 Lipid transfer protein [Medicago truncatula]RHN61247.1 putative bifunctional inhibitor/plant lipid transfer protein/seed storage helical [Medicago truncatula]
MEAYKKIMIVGILLIIANTMLLIDGQSLCQMTNKGLKACEPYVSGVKIAAFQIPSDACCHATAKADLECLCSYKDSGLLSFYGIDPDQAMDLPVKCKLVDSFNC